MPEASDQPAPKKKRKKKFTALKRALRFLFPYRSQIMVSMVCAVFVGLTAIAGLSTLLPVLRVLLEGDTVQSWIDRQVVENRLGVTLADVQVTYIVPGSNAENAGLALGDRFAISDSANAKTPDEVHAAQAEVLAALADATRSDALIEIEDKPPVRATLAPVPWHLGTLQHLAYQMSPHPVWAIATLFLVVGALSLVANTIRFFQEHLSDRASIHAVNDIRRRFYDHVLHIPLPYFLQRGTSDVTSRLVADASVLQDGIRILLGQTIQQPIVAACAFLLALAISWQLTLLIVIFAPIMYVVMRKLGKKFRRANRAALQQNSIMLGQIESSLNGVRVVKSANAERFERRRYKGIMRRLLGEQIRMSRYESLTTPLMEFAALIVAGTILTIASYFVLVSRTLDASSFLLVMACLVTIGESLRKIGKLNNVLQRSNVAATRLFEILDLPPEYPRTPKELADERGGQQLTTVREQVRFENVTYTYPGGNAPAVDGVDLTVAAGTSMAVVGRNGSGKTTLLTMLPRLFDPNGGRITIDGVDNRDFGLRSLRSGIAVVTQDSVIFPGTIADNIAYGLPNATRDDIIAAAQQAFAHDFIVERDLGYDAPLDGLGGQLSGGQKQRLCIARAILRNSPILILDEATSQVDAESEHLIQKAIESLVKGRTTFVIAHRFSTIMSADMIAVMERGKIVGLGTHEELQKSCEVYQQLYERQLLAPTS